MLPPFESSILLPFRFAEEIAFSEAGRHIFCTVLDEGKERDCFVLIAIGTERGVMAGWAAVREWEKRVGKRTWFLTQ